MPDTFAGPAASEASPPNAGAAAPFTAWQPWSAASVFAPEALTAVDPMPLPEPHWVARQRELAASLGLASWLERPEALQALSGQRVAGQPPVYTVAYSGHQFGVWAGQLGDGRAHLLGECATAAGPMELQLKGAGRTPYSRMGDGRAVLRSSIREYLASEAMAALGIPTTRALALVGSPLGVRRERVESAAVVTRVAPSFLRFGHFEHATHTLRSPALLERLVRHAAQRGHPQLDAAAPLAELAPALLQAVAQRSARLVAQWQAVGFCHGVLNTDNLSMLGLTLDYGPYGFLDAHDPGHICNHSDHHGRYAYDQQPGIVLWGLHALAHALGPALGGDVEAARTLLEPFADDYRAALTEQMRAKLGLIQAEPDDIGLIADWFQLLAAHGADHTRSHRLLAQAIDPAAAPAEHPRDEFLDRAAFDAWAASWRQRLAREPLRVAERQRRMDAANPRYVLRNHLAQQVIEAAEGGDFAPLEQLQQILQQPYAEQPEHAAYAAPAPAWARSLEVSCSS